MNELFSFNEQTLYEFTITINTEFLKKQSSLYENNYKKYFNSFILALKNHLGNKFKIWSTEENSYEEHYDIIYLETSNKIDIIKKEYNYIMLHYELILDAMKNASNYSEFTVLMNKVFPVIYLTKELNETAALKKKVSKI